MILSTGQPPIPRRNSRIFAQKKDFIFPRSPYLTKTSHPVSEKGPAVLFPRVLTCAQLFRKRLGLVQRSRKATGPQAAGTAFQRSHRASCRNPPYQTPDGIKRYLNAIKRGHSMAGKPDAFLPFPGLKKEWHRALATCHRRARHFAYCGSIQPTLPPAGVHPPAGAMTSTPPVPIREFHVTRGASGVEIHFKGVWHLADIDRSN